MNSGLIFQEVLRLINERLMLRQEGPGNIVLFPLLCATDWKGKINTLVAEIILVEQSCNICWNFQTGTFPVWAVPLIEILSILLLEF